MDSLPGNFKPYLDESHYNNTIYRARDKDLNSKIKKVLKDGLKLYFLYRKDKEISKNEEFKLLTRILKEQKGKSSKHISPNSLQNPTDPDATYRKKEKKKYIGYTANLIEKFDDKKMIITGYDLQKNIYSDQKFAKETSILRRRYKIDHLPVRGLIRVKVYLGFKISAINCKRLIKELMNKPKAGLPTLLYHYLFSLFSF